jgi:hypothetical protein
MKKLALLLILIVTPLVGMSQNDAPIIIEASTIKTEMASTDLTNRRDHNYFVAKTEVVQLNYKKSQDLISIRSFRKTTQLRSKNKRRC